MAKPFYEKYIELTSAEPEKFKKQLIEAYKYVGYYLSQNEDMPGALALYEKALALEPTDTEAIDAIKALKDAMGGK